jgi:hypothetical protein
MFSIESSPKAWLHQVYLDLGNFQAVSPHHYKVQFNYNHLVEQTSVPYQVQIILPESFRECLIRESGLYQYQVKNPLELAPELRTPRWQILCDYLTNYSGLTKATQILVIRLLSSLCFHQAVVDYVPPFSETELKSDPHNATLYFLRAISNLTIEADRYLPYNFKELEIIAHNAPAGHITKILAGLQIVVQLARTLKDLQGAEYWREFVNKELDSTLSSLDDFTVKLLMSVYYRSCVFVPLLKKEKEKVIAEMDLCQSYAYPDYGTLTSKVRQISPDAIPVDNYSAVSPTTTNNIDRTVYEVTIEPESLALKQGVNQCMMQLGMAGRVEIISKHLKYLICIFSARLDPKLRT